MTLLTAPHAMGQQKRVLNGQDFPDREQQSR
jgi:hypothetical protein